MENWKNSEDFKAHKKGNQYESIREHIELVREKYELLETAKEKEDMFRSIYEDMSEKIKKNINIDFLIPLLVKMKDSVILMHDEGKTNPFFQKEKMKNKIFIDYIKEVDKKEIVELEAIITKGTTVKQNVSTVHSVISVIYYLFENEYMIANFEKENKLSKKEKKFLRKVMTDFAYLILKHHSSIQGFDESRADNGDLNERSKEFSFKKILYLIQEFQKHDFFFQNYMLKEEFKKWRPTFFKNTNSLDFFEDEKGVIKYTNYMMYTFKQLIFSDFAATGEFLNDAPVFKRKKVLKEERQQNLASLKRDEIYQNAINNKHDSDDINFIRSEILKETFVNYKKNHQNKNVFFLEAPTGSGKTFNSFNLGFEMMNDFDLEKMIYVFPFNALIEQTKGNLEKYLTEEVEVINSEFLKDDARNTVNGLFDEKKINYSEVLFDKQTWNYKYIMTSHVRFFETFFGVYREGNLTLPNLKNSLIILDEIQSYKVESWEYFMETLNFYAELLNIKVLIMSATLPPLQMFSAQDKCLKLIQDTQKYYTHPLFVNRVEFVNQSIEKIKDIEELSLVIKEIVQQTKKNSYLVEMISKRSANEIYEKIKEDNYFKDFLILKINGEDTSETKKKTIEFIKQNQFSEEHKMIVVCTQVIEAGVDIDLAIGIKDTSILESEEQFAGRINRSCKRTGSKVFLIDYSNEKNIYKKDKRVGINVRNEMFFDYLKTKEFEKYYKMHIIPKSHKTEKLKNAILEHNFQSIYYEMRLIEEEMFSLYIVQNDESRRLLEDLEMFLTEDLPYAEKKINYEMKIKKMRKYIVNTWIKEEILEENLRFLNGFYIFEKGEEYLEVDDVLNIEKVNVQNIINNIEGMESYGFD